MKDLERGPRAVLPRSRFSNIPRFHFDSRVKLVFASFFPFFTPLFTRFSPVFSRSRPVLVLLTHQIEIFSTWFIAIGPRRTITRLWGMCKVLFCGNKPSALGFCTVFLLGGSKRSGNTTSGAITRQAWDANGRGRGKGGRKRMRLAGRSED